MKSYMYNQTKHIPFNLLAIVLSLVAGFSILFAPLLTLDVGKSFASVLEISYNMTRTEPVSPTDLKKVRLTPKEMIGRMSLPSDYKLSVNTVTLLSFEENQTKSVEELIDQMREYLTDNLDEIQKSTYEAAADAVTAVCADVVRDEKNDSLVKQGVFEQKEVVSALQQLEQSGDSDAFISYLTAQMTQKEIPVSEEQIAELSARVQAFYAAGQKDGVFSVEYFICGSLFQDKDGKVLIASYKEMIEHLETIIQKIFFNGQGEIDQMLVGIGRNFHQIGVWMTVIACVWFTLAVFAFARIFTRKKIFWTWYVKLVGWIPLLFWFISNGVGYDWMGVSAQSVPIFKAVTSETWIVGVCLLMLWLLSVIMVPMHTKIRNSEVDGNIDNRSYMQKSRQKGAGRAQSGSYYSPYLPYYLYDQYYHSNGDRKK